MTDDGDDSLVGRVARKAGRRFEETKRAYTEGRVDADIPKDDQGRARIVCRRYAERRAVKLDDDMKPACYDPDHPACEGCLRDVRDGSVETW